MNHHAGFAGVLQRFEQGDDCPFRGHIHPGEGFVHEVEPGILGQGAGEEHPLLLAAGQLADLPLGKVGHAHLLEGVQRNLTIFPADRTQPADFAVQAHGDHIQSIDRKVPIDTFSLGDITHQVALGGVGLAIDGHGSRCAWNQPQHRFDKGALTGTVGTDHGDQLAFGQGQFDIPENGFAVVGHGEIIDPQRGVGIADGIVGVLL